MQTLILRISNDFFGDEGMGVHAAGYGLRGGTAENWLVVRPINFVNKIKTIPNLNGTERSS